MVKDKACCSLLLLLPADFFFLLTLQVCYKLNDILSSPNLCLSMLNCQAQSSQIHSTCCTKCMARPVSVRLLQEFLIYSLWPLYFYTVNRPRACICLTGSCFCCLLVSKLISVSVSEGYLSCSA